jgi:hypothetical protein
MTTSRGLVIRLLSTAGDVKTVQRRAEEPMNGPLVIELFLAY